jgi:hypothetical protein
MKKPLPTPRCAKKSPWLDPTKTNLFKDEFQLAKENLPAAYFTPLEPYRWIYEHRGVHLFFKGLARYAPMFPVIAYNGQIASWISPPPSGLGNAIYLVMGHDKTGKLRLVGGNYFTEPTLQIGEPLADTEFFAQYDISDDRDKQRLVLDTVSQSIRSEDKSLLLDIRRECEHFHTMAIYITILTSEGSMFHAAKAVIEGNKPADFSYELFGEIK